MRDRHTAAAFGRPYRIRDEDCDVEALTPADLNFDVDSQIPLAIHQVVHEHYVLEMSKLATILTLHFSPCHSNQTEHNQTQLANRLHDWEDKLPTLLRPADLDESLGPPFWASMLYFHYQ